MIQNTEEVTYKVKEKKDKSQNLRELLKGELVFGARQCKKALKKGIIEKIIFASNCPDLIKQSLSRYALMSNVQLINSNIPNDELGIVCKRQHISLLLEL